MNVLNWVDGDNWRSVSLKLSSEFHLILLLFFWLFRLKIEITSKIIFDCFVEMKNIFKWFKVF